MFVFFALRPPIYVRVRYRMFISFTRDGVDCWGHSFIKLRGWWSTCWILLARNLDVVVDLVVPVALQVSKGCAALGGRSPVY